MQRFGIASRPSWRRLALVLSFGLQPLQGQTTQPDTQGPRTPLLRHPDTVSPAQAFAHLQAGNRRYHQAAGKPLPAPEPHLAGRFLAAVMHSPLLPAPCATLFHTRHRDLYTLSSPGPRARLQEVAILERLVRKHRLSLLVILVRDDDPWLDRKLTLPTTLRAAHRRQLNATRTLARSAKIPFAAAHGMRQAEAIWRSSAYLDQQRLRRRFQIAVGRIQPRSGAVDWLTHWHDYAQLVGPDHARELRLLMAERAQRGGIDILRRNHGRLTNQVRLLAEDHDARAEALVLELLGELRRGAVEKHDAPMLHELDGLIDRVRRRQDPDRPQNRRYRRALELAANLVAKRRRKAAEKLQQAEVHAGIRPALQPRTQPGGRRSAPASPPVRGH